MKMLTTKNLQKMLYLPFWDCYIPAPFKDAPPVCDFCRQAGHIAKECSVLKSTICHRCKKKGHMMRYCSKDKQDFTVFGEQY